MVYGSELLFSIHNISLDIELEMNIANLSIKSKKLEKFIRIYISRQSSKSICEKLLNFIKFFKNLKINFI